MLNCAFYKSNKRHVSSISNIKYRDKIIKKYILWSNKYLKKNEIENHLRKIYHYYWNYLYF